VKENKKLQSIYDYKLKSNVLDLILKSKDLKHLINNTLRNIVKSNLESNNKSNISGLSCFNVVQLRTILNNYKRGVYKMDYKKLRKIYESGCEIHDYYIDKNAKNKIEGITYKILNLIKVGNKNDFMQTILRIFSPSEKIPPEEILQIFVEEDLDFESVGYAFVTGLISGKYEGKDKLPNEKEEK
ncbi:TPA: type I-B CRISPR-associated protein Cas8b1/Cst1, partial [Clostridioides difficile]|nr:type I-B CRISPR-associated protein Cas8b1/Cst1 [Clostridioides difficile]